MVAGTATRPRAPRSLSRPRPSPHEASPMGHGPGGPRAGRRLGPLGPPIELGIVSAYFQCLGKRPDRLPRFLAWHCGQQPISGGRWPARQCGPLPRVDPRGSLCARPFAHWLAHRGTNRPRIQVEIAPSGCLLRRGDVARPVRARKATSHFGMRRGSVAIRSGKSGPDVMIRPKASPHAAFT